MSITIDPRTLQRCPADIDEAIAFLRLEGLSMIETMWVLVHHRDVRLNEAKERVDTSQTWADRRGQGGGLMEELEAMLAEEREAAPNASPR